MSFLRTDVPWLKSTYAAITHSLLSLLLVLLTISICSIRSAEASEIFDPGIQAAIENTRELIRQGNVVAAVRSLAAIQKERPDDPEAMLAIGEMFQELAAVRLEQLRRLAPESAAVHELLGKSLESQGRLDEAKQEYQRALSTAPNTPGLHFLLGNVHWKLRNFGAAESELKEELKMNPHHAMANLRMGQILLDTERGVPMRAVLYLREATATTDPKSLVEAHRELGKALRLAHRFPEAVKELQFVVSKAPNDDSVHAQLAAVYRDMGDRDLARQEMDIHASILRKRLEASQREHNQSPQ